MDGKALRHSTRVLGYRQFQVKGYVETAIADEGRAPTYDMIKTALGIATRGEISRIIQALEKRGVLSRVDSVYGVRGRPQIKPPLSRDAEVAEGSQQLTYSRRFVTCRASPAIRAAQEQGEGE